MRTHSPRTLFVVGLVGTSMVLAACGATKRAESPTPDTGDIRAKVAAFTCPEAAVNAGTPGTGPLSGSRLQIVTTVAPITSIVANIAGDRAEVNGTVPEGTNSHTYEPKPSVAKLLATADVVFVNGLKLEDPTLALAQQNLADGAQLIELGTTALPTDLYLYDFSFPKEGGKPNPHLWTNPPMARCYAQIAASVLSKADPTNASYYADNLTRYLAKVDALDAALRTATATVDRSKRKLLTYHDAYAYFAAEYDWDVIGAIQVSNFEDPTPKEIAGLIDQITSEGVPAIFGSEVFPSPVLTQIGKETGVKYVDVLRDDDLLGTPGDPEHTFLALMQFDFVTMVRSLGGDPAALEAVDTTNVVTDNARYPQ